MAKIKVHDLLCGMTYACETGLRYSKDCEVEVTLINDSRGPDRIRIHFPFGFYDILCMENPDAE